MIGIETVPGEAKAAEMILAHVPQLETLPLNG